MATTTYTHVQVGIVDSSGNVNVLYPVNYASDVQVDKSKNKVIPSSISNLQELLNNIGEMAFSNGNDLVYLGNSTDFPDEAISTEIDDSKTDLAYTWSSKKISTECETYIPNPNNITKSLENVTKLFKTATKFTVDGRTRYVVDSVYAVWFVEYIPYTISTNGTVYAAYQKWVGFPSLTTKTSKPYVFTRVYFNNSWGPFVQLSV